MTFTSMELMRYRMKKQNEKQKENIEMGMNINKAFLGGRLTADPELKTTPSGNTVTSFTVAIDRRHGKNEEKKTDFINCVAWNKKAELITKYFAKGSQICVIGQIQTRSWKDNNGNTRYATEVIVDEVSFVDGKGHGNAESTGNDRCNYSQSAQTDYPADAQFEELADDDDVPF